MQSTFSAKRYTLATLLICVTVICATLGLFYPRAKYAVTATLPGLNVPSSRPNSPPLTHGYDFLGDSAVIERIMNTSPSAAEYLKDVSDKGHYLRDMVKITQLENATYRFEATGGPTERRKLRSIVDAVADAVVGLHATKLEKQISEYQAILANSSLRFEAEIASLDGRDHKMLNQMRKLTQGRIKELDAIRSDVTGAEVVDRENVMAF